MIKKKQGREEEEEVIGRRDSLCLFVLIKSQKLRDESRRRETRVRFTLGENEEDDSKFNRRARAMKGNEGQLSFSFSFPFSINKIKNAFCAFLMPVLPRRFIKITTLPFTKLEKWE